MEVLIINNPLNIPEILLHVLYYVGGSNSGDLIPCRQVNRNWNNVVTELLRKRGICVSLNNDNIQPYRELLGKCRKLDNRNPEEQLVSEHHGTQPLDKLSIIIHLPKYGSAAFQDDEGNLSHFHPIVHEVKKLIGAHNCIIEGIVDTHNLIDDPSFCQLLQLTSSTVKTLYFEPTTKDTFKFGRPQSHSEASDEAMGVEEAVPIPGPFLKLQSIKYVIQDLRKLEPLPKPKIFNRLIASAPTLQTLIVQGNINPLVSMEDRRLSFNQSAFVTVIVHGLVQPNNEIPLGLTNLEIPIYNEGSLNAVCQLLLPKLRNLKLHQKITCMYSKSFHRFLAKNCPCLDVLELLILSHCESPRNQDLFDRLDPSNPQIRQITHVGLYLCTTGYAFETEENSNLHKAAMIATTAIISLQFTSLKSIGVDLYGLGSLVFALRSHGQNHEPIQLPLPPNLRSFYSNINFPNVSSLSISLSYRKTFLSLHYADDNLFHSEDDDVETEEDVARLITAYTESIFPSLAKLVVTHEDDEDTLDFYLTRISQWGMDGWIRKSGLKSILRMNGPGIQSLEVNNYFEWFEFLVENDDENTLNNLWQSVRHLKFGGDARKRRQRDENTPPFKVMDIHFEHFPNLESVQIQEEILTTKKSDAQLVPFDNVLEQLNVFRASYPNIKIELC